MNPLWTDFASAAGLQLSDSQLAAFSRYLDLLDAANQTMNLTRITDRAQAELLHIADALTLLKFLPAGPHTLADLGSGGGVPGIPLAIARPDAKILLVESTRKKANFLRETAATLGLQNVEVSDQRAEDLGRSDRRGMFHIVTARAVALLPWLIEWAMPLLRKSGKLLAMKGERAGEELAASKRAIRLLHAGEPVVTPAPLPGSEGHVIIQIAKPGPTPDTYPRLASIAKGKHL
jgi:16S rRNA (guanine527-N7)-methyltransferase